MDGLVEKIAQSPEPKLEEKQRQQVKRWILGKDPRQYGFDFGLWSRRIVQALIQDKLGVALGLTAVGRLLASLEITPQKPLRRACERDPQAVQWWLDHTYPPLKKRAKRLKAKIFFLDEAGFQSDGPLGRTYGLKGKTPVVKTSGQRQSINVISAVNARGEFWVATYDGPVYPRGDQRGQMPPQQHVGWESGRTGPDFEGPNSAARVSNRSIRSEPRAGSYRERARCNPQAASCRIEAANCSERIEHRVFRLIT